MSTTRRSFLRNGALAIMALPTLRMPAEPDAEARWGAVGARAGRIKFDRILVDARRAQALAFGDTARQLGARVRGISGDIDDPCYAELRYRWRIAPAPVAGITDLRSLLLLQTMASDAGMHAVLRIHHCDHAASTAHEAFGPASYEAAATARLAGAGIHWSGAAARLVLDLAADDPQNTRDIGSRSARERERLCAAQMSAANLRSIDSRMLVTWAIA